MREHLDVLIVGAGLSGIGAAVHLRRGCPGKSFAILEAREAIGGTWDLFRYPGVRSDSDMSTLGYSFQPWTGDAIADGPSILAYIRETAREHGLEPAIRLGHRVRRVAWSSADGRWAVEVERADGSWVRLTTSFLWCCTGYYDYDAGYTPALPGRERFRGTLVHPQHWSGVAYANRRVVVIGSGATAVTLVPALARKAAHVVMLQRSPTYVIARPSRDRAAAWLRRALPGQAAHRITRAKNVLLGQAFYGLAQRYPGSVKRWLVGKAAAALGPGVDAAKHFTPRYRPWDQRLCLAPDGDLFEAIRSGKASVVTGTFETFTERGIRMASGEEIEADLVVTATGLVLAFAGGMEVEVDGRRVVPRELVNYKGVMYSDVPNFAVTLGYTNASWTLKADLTAAYVVRLLGWMDAKGADRCTPRLRDPTIARERFIGLRSGYVERALHWLPAQGSRPPWRLHQSYLRDLWMLRYAPVEDAALELGRGDESREGSGPG